MNDATFSQREGSSSGIPRCASAMNATRSGSCLVIIFIFEIYTRNSYFFKVFSFNSNYLRYFTAEFVKVAEIKDKLRLVIILA